MVNWIRHYTSSCLLQFNLEINTLCRVSKCSIYVSSSQESSCNSAKIQSQNVSFLYKKNLKISFHCSSAIRLDHTVLPTVHCTYYISWKLQNISLLIWMVKSIFWTNLQSNRFIAFLEGIIFNLKGICNLKVLFGKCPHYIICVIPVAVVCT